MMSIDYSMMSLDSSLPSGMSIDYSVMSFDSSLPSGMSIDSNSSMMSVASSLPSGMSIDSNSSMMSVASVSNDILSSYISSTDSVQQGISPFSDMELHVSNVMAKGWFPCRTIYDRVMTLATWLRGDNIDGDFLNYLYTDFVNNGPLSQTFNIMEISWSALPVHF